MKVTIQVDQAVWERTTFEVEVEDGLEGEALRDALDDAIENYKCYGEGDYNLKILDDPVHGIDSDTKALLPDGTEIEL